MTHGHSEVVSYFLEARCDASGEVWDEDGERKKPYSPLQEAVASQWIFMNRLNFVDDFVLIDSSANVEDSTIAQLERKLREWLTIEPDPLKLLDNSSFLAAIRDDSAHAKIITKLLDHDADTTVLKCSNESILHLAVHSEMEVEALLQHAKLRDFDIDMRDRDGRTALHYAAAVCNAEVLELLIERGADISAIDDFGVTTLHFAIGSSNCVRTVLAYGYRSGDANVFLGTLAQFARSVDDTDLAIIKTLEEAESVQ